MPTKHIENTTGAPIYVGGKMIQPGTGRDIDVALLPPEFQDQTATAALAEPTLARTLGVTAHRIARTIHAHPTMNEGVMEAAEAAMGAAIHL